MYPYNNNNYPRKVGGYSVETYEPAVIHPDQRRRAEDLVKMAFTERKPMATVRRLIPRVPQYNIAPQPVLKNVQYARVQKVPVVYNGTNMNRIQIINQNQNNLYRFNNITNVTPVPTVKSMDLPGKSNPFVYQNLIQMNNGYQLVNKNPAIPMNSGKKFVVPHFNNQLQRPILRSNSANNYSPLLRPKLVQQRIITGQNYKPSVYKRNL